MQFHKLTISNITQETKDTKTFYLQIPADLKPQFAFIAGQYLTFKIELQGDELRRSYSICTTTSDAEIGVTVKKMFKGLVSNHMHSKWQVGSEVIVSGPEGNFVVTPDHDKIRNHFFFAAGSGITPVASMIASILEEEPMSNCYLLYGSKAEDQIIFKDRLEAMQNKYEGQLHIVHTLSKPAETKEGGMFGMFQKSKIDWQGLIGRMDDQKVSDLLASAAPKKESHYYLCGPSDMIKMVLAHLEQKGVDKKHIHKEYFTVADADKKDIGASTSVIHVKLNGEDIVIHTRGDKKILDELIDLKKNPPYSCQSGTCSSCIAKVTQGHAEMEVCYALDDDEIAAGYILTCQAKSVTSELHIDFDA